MPELPELEAFVIAQRDRLTADPISAVPVAHFATVKTIDPPVASLAGDRFASVSRRAKRILFTTESGPTLVLHLMSAGKLTVGTSSRPRSTMLEVDFDGGLALRMTETGRKRRAGAWLLRPEALAAELDRLGPEPLDPAFDVAALKAALEAHPHQLHAFLRDQRAVAGIGRAFANEILWAAKLGPYTRTTTLDDEQIERLHQAITVVLSDATQRLIPASKDGLAGKPARGYIVHDQAGSMCPRCGDIIRTVSFEEHTVFYCATCHTGGRVLADRRMSRLLRE